MRQKLKTLFITFKNGKQRTIERVEEFHTEKNQICINYWTPNWWGTDTLTFNWLTIKRIEVK